MHTLEWHSRGYCPHLERKAYHHITFRLYDSLPQKLLHELRELPEEHFAQMGISKIRRIQEYLDAGLGSCVLAQPDAGQIVESSLLYYHGTKYHLNAWVVMPNHVHVLVKLGSATLSEILHGWKSFTSHKMKQLGFHDGHLWQKEYFDRLIRDEKHYLNTWRYIEMNPVLAGLCSRPEQWPFNSARIRLGVNPDHSPVPEAEAREDAYAPRWSQLSY